MKFNVLIDDTTAYIPEDIGIDPYILDAVVTVGGKATFGKMARNGTLELTLNNDGGEFFPNNTTSPFYEKLLPNRIILFYVDDVLKFAGYIENVEVPLSLKKPKVKLTCRQTLQDWSDFFLNKPMYENTPLQNLPGLILDDNEVLSPYSDDVFVIGSSSYDSEVYTENPSDVLVNNLDAQLTIPYASIAWDKEKSVVDAFNDILDIAVGLGFVRADGSVFLCPYYYYITGTAEHTFNLDTLAEEAKFKSKTKVKNRVLVEWSELSENTGTIATFDVDLLKGERITKIVKPTSKVNEEKIYVLKDLSVSSPTATVQLEIVNFSLDSVEVEIFSPGTALTNETITITGTYITENLVEEYIIENNDSILKFRQRYPQRKKNAMLANLSDVQGYISQWLVVLSDDFKYIEEIKITNNDTYKLGERIEFTSRRNFLPAGTRHIITGAKHRYRTDYVESTYSLYGGDAVNGFVIGQSEYDSGAFYV